jgi:hypothetical protein
MQVMQQDLMQCRFNSITEFESFLDALLASGVAGNIQEISKAKEKAI